MKVKMLILVMKYYSMKIIYTGVSGIQKIFFATGQYNITREDIYCKIKDFKDLYEEKIYIFT